jgi:predicted acylesterase/phospholipase RssA
MPSSLPVRRILTLDGGGIRGMISAIWLEALAAPAAAGKGGVRSRFDLIVGSSTGALIAAGLASGIPPRELTCAIRALRRRGVSRYGRTTLVAAHAHADRRPVGAAIFRRTAWKRCFNASSANEPWRPPRRG